MARPLVAFGQRIGRMTGDTAQVEPLDAQGVADAKNEADVGQAADVLQHDADRGTLELLEGVGRWLARDELEGGQRRPLGRGGWRQIGIHCPYGVIFAERLASYVPSMLVF
jgi:hypothetical protein